ncbi:uncharacterized protein SPSK_03782 [Sporothrix schenckii 1099-18]|uniref:Uncharacterized protein n=1 Tax=Sporothrix schenckii 1099-18 TaxID=1397361 RepID=A0A0F2LWZ0_SPOSC|nr:uncharacterized protein SPSK_03782 [Sporothrix schenckii 1099-18]KJR81968.1 hypothetical protein SPSK_03782 [Sporothrix schenckii 1099-18]
MKQMKIMSVVELHSSELDSKSNFLGDQYSKHTTRPESDLGLSVGVALSAETEAKMGHASRPAFTPGDKKLMQMQHHMNALCLLSAMYEHGQV